MSTLDRELRAFLCPDCRGLGVPFDEPGNWQPCPACGGSGWANEELINWLIAKLREWRAERGQQRASEHD